MSKAKNGARPTKEAVITVRMTAELVGALDKHCAETGESRVEAIREMIRLTKPSDTAAAKPPVVKVNVDQDKLDDVAAALRKVAETHSERTRQLQRIGNNWNQLVRLANAGHPVPEEALQGVERVLGRMLGLMEKDAQKAAGIQEAMPWV